MRILRTFLFSSVMMATGYPALLLGSTGSAQVSLPYFYYENFFVGQTPTSGEDIGMVSAEENVAASTFSGIFADFTSGSGDVGVTNTAAALDACVGEMIPNRFRPTGHLAVARHYGGANPPTIDFYATMSWDPQWRYNQNLPITQAPTWSIPTITGNPVLAMDVANGIADTRVIGGGLNLTEYLITVESFGGNLYLASYALSDISGNPVQPFFVSYAPTTLTGSCLGYGCVKWQSFWAASRPHTKRDRLCEERSATSSQQPVGSLHKIRYSHRVVWNTRRSNKQLRDPA